jgi:hypothetical protein
MNIDTSLVRNLGSNLLGEKYALVILGNSLLAETDKLNDVEVNQLLVIEAKLSNERDDDEVKIAQKAAQSAEAYNDIVEAITKLDLKIAQILKNAPSLFRDGEYSPAPGVWNSLGYI